MSYWCVGKFYALNTERYFSGNISFFNQGLFKYKFFFPRTFCSSVKKIRKIIKNLIDLKEYQSCEIHDLRKFKTEKEALIYLDSLKIKEKLENVWI